MVYCAKFGQAANKALYLTAIPLRFIAAGELGRSLPTNVFNLNQEG